jgi:hypothetical protein
VGFHDEGASRYSKTAEVTAIRVDHPFTVTRDDWGGIQTGKPGDYLVCSEDGDAYPVDANVFYDTYEPTDAAHRYRKSATILAVQLTDTMTVDTLEGPETGHSGDWLAENPGGDRWLIHDDVFRRTYVPV